MRKQELMAKRDDTSKKMGNEIKNSPQWLELQKELIAATRALSTQFQDNDKIVLCYA